MPVFKNKKIKGGQVVPVENGRPEHVKDTPYNDEQEIEYYLEFARKKNLGNKEIASNKNGTHFTMCGNLEMNIEKDGVALRSNKYKLGCGEIVELLSDFYNKFDEDEREYLNYAVSSRRSTFYPVSWESIFFKKMPTVKRTFVADETHAQTVIQQPILFIDKNKDVYKTGVKQTGWYFWNGELDDSNIFVRKWEYNTESKEFFPVIEKEFLNDTSLENVLFNGKYYNFLTDHEAATEAKKSLLFELYFYKNEENKEKLYFDTKVSIQQYTLLVEQLTANAKRDETRLKVVQQNLDEKIKLFEDLNSENNTTKRYLLSVTSFDEERDKIIRELSKAKRQEQDEEGSFLNIFGFGSRIGKIQRIKLEAEKKILEHKNELKKFEIEQQRRQQAEEEEKRRLALLSVEERKSAKRILEELPDKLKQENVINAQNKAQEREEELREIELERQRKQKEERIKREEQERLDASPLSIVSAIDSITSVATQASNFADTTQKASINLLTSAASSAASSLASTVLPAAQYVGLAPPTLSKEANEVDLDEVDRFFKEQLEKDTESTSSEFTRQPLQQNKTSQGIGQHFKLPLSNQYGHVIGPRVSASAIRRLGASPIPKVRASPIRRVGARIGARVGLGPIRKVGSSPIRKVGTRVGASPIRKVGIRVGASPIRKVGTRVGASPIRRVNASRIRRRIGASSINRRIR